MFVITTPKQRDLMSSVPKGLEHRRREQSFRDKTKYRRQPKHKEMW